MQADTMEQAVMTPAGARHLLRYQVLSDNEPVGELLSEQLLVVESGRSALFLRNQLAIRASSFWSDYVLDSEEEMLLDAEGLCRYAGISTEDGEQSAVTGMRETDALTLHIKEERIYTERFALSTFDATSQNAASDFLARGDGQATWRVLDLETFEIDSWQLRRLPEESLQVCGQTVSAQVVSIDICGQHSRSTAWYVHRDDACILVREIKEELGERNEVILINWDIQHATT
ncbi:hypothetical protein HNQ59_000016 [Chitinivorax tropicus]|uniref:Uncharacterized protein n=1 Tax=Chitinivorax tropicus TaxID=714531 RepID=A0A840MBP7_9PROT|nr:hypothetical protein [Chitinivorax tropicus]MBB5016754.1 hypothetical protein [Chitinivorax tropicus]